MTLAHTTLPSDYKPAADMLNGRVALVTGAGQGLGRIAALAFAKHGASVILHGRNVQKLEMVYDEIIAAGFPEPAILPLDYLKTTQAELDAFIQSIHATFNRLDIVFHGASHFISCMPLAMHDLDTWQQHARVNLVVPAALTKACLPLLKRAADASVIFLTETHAVDPRAFWGAFSVTKSALVTLAAIWADEMDGQSNVRFNTCLPGPVASPMRAKSHPGEVASRQRQMDGLARYFLYLPIPLARHFPVRCWTASQIWHSSLDRVNWRVAICSETGRDFGNIRKVKIIVLHDTSAARAQKHQ